MPSSYRIEVSPNNRAGCQDTVCKAAKVKIMKGEIRFGTWVVMPNSEHGSWRWKHWGCVSGAQVQGMRESTSAGGEDGEYDWDLIDGYDELGDHPEVQDKIRRVVEQGFIDPEDFKGDPEFNKLGQRGIRGRAKKAKAEEAEDAEDDDDVEEVSSPKKKKGKHAKDQSVDEYEPPTKKAKISKKTKKKGSDDKDEVSLIKIGSRADTGGSSHTKDGRSPMKTKGYEKPTVEDTKDVDLASRPRDKFHSKKPSRLPPMSKRKAAETEVDHEDGGPPSLKKPRATKALKAATPVLPKAAVTEVDDEYNKPLRVTRRRSARVLQSAAPATRKAVVTEVADSEDEDDDDDDEPLSATRPRITRAV